MNLLYFGTFLLALSISSSAVEYYDDDYNADDSKEETNDHNSCDENTNCPLPNCSCFGQVPLKVETRRLPQFVMVTFDDAVTPLNMKTYRKVADGRLNSNGCPMSTTFFVTHEYNDYEFVNEMYKKGHEIAVHSITHESNTDMWKQAAIDRWRNEMVGMRDILSRFALVPKSEVKGHRAPFLQTAGDDTFRMLLENGFAYDSSMPTRAHMDPPLWPYTLDFGFRQDCQIQPCPESNFPGLWLFPMVQWQRISWVRNSLMTFHCSMLDACTPYPKNATDTYAYLLDNFERHYISNRAPFPVFLHEAWIRDENRLQGFTQFLNDLLKRDDVFVVSMREVLEYMRNPVTLEKYRARKGCFADTRPKKIADSKKIFVDSHWYRQRDSLVLMSSKEQNRSISVLMAGECSPRVCNYPKRKILMKSCVSCPKRFPWLENTEGVILKKS